MRNASVNPCAFLAPCGPLVCSPIGNFGDLEAFSFHATKAFNTCEGGGIATNDDALAQRCRLARNFGASGF
jgi:dTDP-4-amino-4,6-dideoxygalactose transaminase